MVKITYEGADILICPTQTEGVTAFIACNDAMERAFSNMRMFPGARLRTVFGLTCYTHDEGEYKQLIASLKAAKLTLDYGHL